MLKGARVHLGATVIMFGGCLGVLALVIAINGLAPPAKRQPAQKQTTFSLPPKAALPKVRRTRRKPPPRRKKSVAPKPNLLSSLRGPSFGIPGLGLDALLDGSDGVLGGDRRLTMTEDTVDEPPKASRQRPPVYPQRARARGITGYVLLNLLIGADGNVEEVKVLEAQPTGVFEKVAEGAVRHWRFSPATYQGEAVRVWAKQLVRFNLS